MIRKKISELPECTSFKGLWTIGVNALNKSVKVSLEYIQSVVDGMKSATKNATDAASTANSAAQTANNAAQGAQTATTAANTATTNANKATSAAIKAKEDCEAAIAIAEAGSHFFGSYDEFPKSGNPARLYIDTVNESIYRWDEASAAYRCVGWGINDGDEVILTAQEETGPDSEIDTYILDGNTSEEAASAVVDGNTDE